MSLAPLQLETCTVDDIVFTGYKDNSYKSMLYFSPLRCIKPFLNLIQGLEQDKENHHLLYEFKDFIVSYTKILDKLELG